MSFENLKTNHLDLVHFLKEHDYSASVIQRVSYEIRNILANAEKYNWHSYKDIYRACEKKGSSKDVLRWKRYCLRMIKRFDIYGEFPNRKRRSYLFESDAYENLPPEYRELIEFYRKYDTSRGKKESTIYHETANAITFLCSMQQKGCLKLQDITEKDVLSFFLSDDGSLIRGCSYKKNISAVFKAGTHWNAGSCGRILSFLPAFRKNRKIIQYLSKKEADLIQDALQGKDDSLSLRNRAIGTLLLYTGLRGCDISGLLLGNIDWEHDILHIPQQKTDVPMELPLTSRVGNAIFDYLELERPESNDPHVFLSEVKPYHPLSGKSIGNIAFKIYKAANVRQTPGDRKGTHIFRHHVASHMLENGIPQPVISRTLGHTSPDSLEPYLMADFKHLKECALSVEAFPVSGEVFTL